MAIKYEFTKETMDVVMETVRKFQCTPSEAINKLLTNINILQEVTDDIRNKRERISENN